MPDFDIRNLPFLTRKMLSFESAASFSLRVTVQSTDTIPIAVTGATKDGSFTFSIIPTNDRAPQDFDLGISDLPLWVSVLDTETEYERGQLYVIVSLLVNGNPVHQLTAGYVYRQNGITYPATSNVEPSSSFGALVMSSSADPAAGAEISYTSPDFTFQKIRGARFTLVTSATVANRRVHVVVTPIGGPALNFISSVDQPASTTRHYTLAPISGLGTYSDDNDIIIPISPDLVIPGVSTVTTETTNIQVGDNFSVMSLYCEDLLLMQ